MVTMREDGERWIRAMAPPPWPKSPARHEGLSPCLRFALKPSTALGKTKKGGLERR